MIKRILLLVAIFVSCKVWSQSGEISGKIVDEKGQPLPAIIQLVDDAGKPTGKGAAANYDGFFSIKPLAAGSYNVLIKFQGYSSELKTGVPVSAGANRIINQKLSPQTKTIGEGKVVIKAQKFVKPLIDPGETTGGANFNASDVKENSSRKADDIVSQSAGVVQEDNGSKINVGGTRSEESMYIIDGVKMRGTPNVASTSIAQLQVLTAGIPARYGDVTGGVINITTKGPANKFSGSAEIINSRFLDPWGYNLANVSLSGPIIKDKKTGRTKLGYFVSGEFEYQKDKYPFWNGTYKVKDDVLDYYKENPLMFQKDGKTITFRANQITADDIQKVKTHQNTQMFNYRANGKLDYKLNNEMNLTLGGGANLEKFNEYTNIYTLFNTENNPLVDQKSYRGFIRFTHNLGAKSMGEDQNTKDKKPSAIQNAYYTVQADYEHFTDLKYSAKHKLNAFEYGYIGKFDINRAPTYEFGTTRVADGRTLNTYRLVGEQDTAVFYTPGDLNPTSANLTEDYFELIGDKSNKYAATGGYARNIGQIASQNGLINGTRGDNFIQYAYSPAGRQYGGMAVEGDNDQYRFRFDGAFDILKAGSKDNNRHSIEFGFEFEQRVIRKYSILPLASGAGGIWGLARSLANGHIARNTTDADPVVSIGGVQKRYSEWVAAGVSVYETDTIVFQNAQAGKEAAFSKNLRNRLGITNNLQYINVDAVDIKSLSLDLFSADELVQNWSNNRVNYWGYTHYGERLDYKPAFNDFFTKKDADGNYTRPIDAMRPIYFAGYVQDKFQFKDLTFNLGLRVDRYDANTKVLKDKYSLYAIKTAGETSGSRNTSGAHPGNIGSDFKVYVADSKNDKSSIVGYRDGDEWYDANGNSTTGAAIVNSGGGQLQPNFVTYPDSTTNMAGANYDPNQTFTDYKPVINVMPRLQFSFNLSDEALFFAHYDILARNPSDNQLFASPLDWYNLATNRDNSIANPNLKTSKTVNYQLGFKQKVGENSAFTFTVTYKEARNNIGYTLVPYAYPRQYYTYGNTDFSTYKAFMLEYEMRRVNNLKLRANYTLSFAEGTGSNVNTQQAIVQNTNQNLKLISPLDFDSRHVLNATVDYRFAAGKEYNGPTTKSGKQPLADFGINLQGNVRSGNPYTAQSNITSEAFAGQVGGGQRPSTKGQINGARLPWRYNLNLKFDKTFDITLKKKDGEGNARALGINVYLQIKNLLNTGNILQVYRYTGTPNDDGFITSPQGITQAQAQETASGTGQAFKDIYKIALNTPDGNAYGRATYYSMPRTIQLGASLNF